MKTLSIGIMAFAVVGLATGIHAQSHGGPSGATSGRATMEARVVNDSNGCPAAVDIWLVSTTDTIQGIEMVLQWDHPDRIEFAHGAAKPSAKPTAADSVAAMLNAGDPASKVIVQRDGTLLSKWEFVEARSTATRSVKILGVAKLLGQDEPSPVLPGSSGALMRLPVAILAPATGAADSDSVALNFDSANTRFSTQRGVLFDPLTLKGATISLTACGKSKGAK